MTDKDGADGSCRPPRELGLRLLQLRRGVEVIGLHRAKCELSHLWHQLRTRPAPPALPVRPDLARGADARSTGVKREVVLFPPATERMNRARLYHGDASKPIAYSLTTPRKGLVVSIVSADILQFVPMSEAPNRIRELRLAVRPKLSQQALGDRVGTTKMTISELERGKVRLDIDHMRRISKALGVTPADLLLPTDNPYSLDARETALIDLWRAATSEEREQLQRVSEALLAFRPEPARVA